MRAVSRDDHLFVSMWKEGRAVVMRSTSIGSARERCLVTECPTVTTTPCDIA